MQTAVVARDSFAAAVVEGDTAVAVVLAAARHTVLVSDIPAAVAGRLAGAVVVEDSPAEDTPPATRGS